MRPSARFLTVLTLLVLPLGGCFDAYDTGVPDMRGNGQGNDPGPPIYAPDHVWSWVPFPEALCMNGTSTGIGVNLARGSRKVLIVLEGGGACFDGISCTLGTIHQDGFNKDTLELVLSAIGRTGTMDRNNPENPFAGWSYVFVPYCTGDIHAGNRPNGPGGRMHVGYANMGHYLRRLVPTFADAEQVVLSGSSAGGFGAAYNFDRVQRAFGKIPVHLLDDSGPVMSDEYLKPCLQRRFRDAWNLAATLPPDCAACRAGDGGLVNLALFLAAKYPERRAGILSSQYDETIRAFFASGYSECKGPGYFPPGDFADGLEGLRRDLAGSRNFRVYYIPSIKHTWLMDQPLGLGMRVSGTRLTDWLRAFADGGPAWRDVTP